MYELSDKALVKLVLQDGEIRRIAAIEEKIPEYYKILDREEKRELLVRERKLYESYVRKCLLLPVISRIGFTLFILVQ